MTGSYERRDEEGGGGAVTISSVASRPPRSRLAGAGVRPYAKSPPPTHFINWQQDPFGNYLARIVFPEPVRLLSFEVDLIADMVVINPFDFFVERIRLSIVPPLPRMHCASELAPYGWPVPGGDHRDGRTRLREGKIAAAIGVDAFRGGTPADGCIPTTSWSSLNQRLQRDIDYSIRMEPGVQTPRGNPAEGRGSCRDSGWLLVQILRHLGLAARFVSGYLVQFTADVKALDGPSGPERDFTDLHAWTEVYVPGAGWIGLDPTSGLFAGEGHIPLACTPHPVSAAPITGKAEKCKVEFSFSNNVQRIHEDPRVTKPYTEEEWNSIDALGRQIDESLEAGDVRLTMGGEPTFVSIDDMESAQWNDRRPGHPQAGAGRGPGASAQEPLRTRRTAALRPGQVVPGRARCRAGR